MSCIFYIFIFLYNVAYVVEKCVSRSNRSILLVLLNWSHAGQKQKEREGKKACTQGFAILIVVIRSYEWSLICLKRAFVRDGSARIVLELYRMADWCSQVRIDIAKLTVEAVGSALSQIASIVFNENGFIRVDCTI